VIQNYYFYVKCNRKFSIRISLFTGRQVHHTWADTVKTVFYLHVIMNTPKYYSLTLLCKKKLCDAFIFSFCCPCLYLSFLPLGIYGTAASVAVVFFCNYSYDRYVQFDGDIMRNSLLSFYDLSDCS
jgi:hypothetical protein